MSVGGRRSNRHFVVVVRRINMLDPILGDIWAEYGRRPDVFLVIPTNGSIRRDGCAVMGRGLALQAARRFPDVPVLLGKDLTRQRREEWKHSFGPTTTVLPHRLIAFPVKYEWAEKADLKLIEHSAERLAKWLQQHPSQSIVLPCVGCGNGRLTWPHVRLRLEALDAFDIACRVRVIDIIGIR